MIARGPGLRAASFVMFGVALGSPEVAAEEPLRAKDCL
jgi:hypothetical protein